MVSGYPTFKSIPRADGLSTDTPVLGRHSSQLGIRVKVNEYLGSSGLGIHKFSLDTSFTAWYQSLGIRVPRAWGTWA